MDFVLKFVAIIFLTLFSLIVCFWFYKLTTIPVVPDYVQVSPAPPPTTPPIIRNPWFTNKPSTGDEPNDIINQQLRK